MTDNRFVNYNQHSIPQSPQPLPYQQNTYDYPQQIYNHPQQNYLMDNQPQMYNSQLYQSYNNMAVPMEEIDTAMPETVESNLFVPGFLKTQIGKLMRVEFLIGNSTEDRVGVLKGVGASYILLQPVGESVTIMCDLFSIKFASIINVPIGDEVVIVP